MRDRTAPQALPVGDAHPSERSGGLRTIGVIELIKGFAVLVAGTGALRLIHRPTQEFAEELVRHMHLNPASHYPRIFLEAFANIDDHRLMVLAAFAMCYAGLHITEGIGLWLGRRWAEWLGTLSGSVYIPVEIWHLIEGVTPLRVALLVVNVAVVAYLARALIRHTPRPKAYGETADFSIKTDT